MSIISDKSTTSSGSDLKSNSAAAFDPWIIWVTFRRYWPVALPAGGVLAAVTALVVLKSFVPMYRASHLLESNQDFVVFKNVMPSVKNLASTEKTLFFNPIVVDPVLADPEFRFAPSLSNPETAEANLIKNLRVISGGTGSRLLVSYQDSDREAAAMICNAVVESYLRQRDAFDNARVSNLERWLEPEIQRWEQAVEERQRVVQKLSEQTLGYAPGKQASVMESRSNFDLATSLRAQITQLNLKISVDEAKVAMLAADHPVGIEPEENFREEASERQWQQPDPTELEIENLVRRDSRTVEVRNRLRQYETAILEIEDQGRIGIRRDEYERYQEKYASYESLLRDTQAKARVDAIAKLKEAAAREHQIRLAAKRAEARGQKQQIKRIRSQNLADERFQLEESKTKLSLIQQQYEQERERLEQFGGATAELQFAQEELGVATDVLHKLRDRVAAIRTERRQDGAVRSLAPARPPRNPIESVPMKKLVTYCGGTMAIPFFLCLLWELRVQRLTDSGMCDKHGLSVIGEVAALPSALHVGSARRLFEESIDTLRTNLFLSEHSAGVRSIAVVSSMSGEGKSSVSSQLALSIAKATGQSVLLVDADLRCPEQHEIFGLDMSPGLCGVLFDGLTLPETIRKTRGQLVHLLPAGPPSSNQHRLLNAENMQAFVQAALREYQYVIFDTAPVLSAGESLAVATSVDTTLVCVMRDVSRVDHVLRASQRLVAAGAKIAGTVFSGISARQYVYRYGDYYLNKPATSMNRVA